MKTRITTAILCLAYLAMALVFGVVHHHEHAAGNGPNDCAACKWQLSTTGAVPIVFGVVVFTSIILMLLPPRLFCIIAEFPAATASRAPPLSPR